MVRRMLAVLGELLLLALVVYAQTGGPGAGVSS